MITTSLEKRPAYNSLAFVRLEEPSMKASVEGNQFLASRMGFTK